MKLTYLSTAFCTAYRVLSVAPELVSKENRRMMIADKDQYPAYMPLDTTSTKIDGRSSKSDFYLRVKDQGSRYERYFMWLMKERCNEPQSYCMEIELNREFGVVFIITRINDDWV